MQLKTAHITLSMGVGGIENCILNIVGTLNQNAYSSTVICLDSGGALLESVKDLGIKTFIAGRKPGTDMQLIFRLARYFRRHRFHIIHTHNQAAHFYGGIAARVAGVPIVITTEHSRHNIDVSHRRILEKKILFRLTDQWVLVSDELYHHSLVSDKLQPDKCKVIVNGIDIEKYNKNKTDTIALSEAKKQEIGLPRSAKIIIMVARLHPIKNHLLLLEAFALLKDTFPDANIVLAGDGECYELLKNKAGQLDIQEKVFFLGNRQDIAELLHISDVFVLCSLSEGLPLSLLEAAAASVPVVITQSANKSGFIENKGNGTVVNNSPEALAEALGNILKNPDNFQYQVANGFERIKENYAITSMVNQYDQLYRELSIKKNIRGQ